MFSYTIFKVLRLILIASTILEGLSSMMITSLASTAASDPIAPIAIPASARARTGASFIPSPTKINEPRFFPFFERSLRSSSTFASLSALNS